MKHISAYCESSGGALWSRSDLKEYKLSQPMPDEGTGKTRFWLNRLTLSWLECDHAVTKPDADFAPGRQAASAYDLLVGALGVRVDMVQFVFSPSEMPSRKLMKWIHNRPGPVNNLANMLRLMRSNRVSVHAINLLGPDRAAAGLIMLQDDWVMLWVKTDYFSVSQFIHDVVLIERPSLFRCDGMDGLRACILARPWEMDEGVVSGR
jgi:hypothetical protein